MFHILPGNFFVPLSSPNRIVYWECICKLFSIMEHQLSFGVERDVLVEELEYYFDQTQAAEMEEEEFQALDSRGKANSMIRKLENYGWIAVETDKSYVQRVNFKEYAVKIIKTLLEIADGKQIEYQGYIYAIYTLARSNMDQPGVILLQILENTDQLITALKNLNSNIKQYIDDLTKHKTVAELMNALFNDYITNIVDKAYHRLRTSDNVSKFRPEIIERLESKSHNKDYIAKASQEIAGIREISEEDGRELVYKYLHEIITFSSERYEFIYMPSGKYRNYYDMIMDDFNVVQGESIFSGIFHETHKEVIDELFERLALNNESSSKTLAEFTDYRTYMDYDIKIIHSDGTFSYYSKVCEEKSGGETQTPFYVTVAASFVQLYTNNIGGEAAGLVMFDEAFNNMDDERIGGVLEFMNRLPLQLIIAAPPDKIQYIGPSMEETLLVMTDEKISFVEKYCHEI